MNKNLSAYLDVIRFSSALIVFFGHLSYKPFTDGLFWQAQWYMNDAVTIFFVLSGFVISHATQREASAQTYAIARLARIYSVALPALLVTFALDSIGRHFNADLYSSLGNFNNGNRWLQALSAGLFLNQLWFLDVHPGTNLPYWSLGYEVWYYIFFGAVMFAPRRQRWIAAALVLIIAGPRIVAMSGVWMLGFASHKASNRFTIDSKLGLTIFIGTFLILAALSNLLQYHPLPEFPITFPYRPRIIWDYFLAIIFALQLISFKAIASTIAPIPARSAGIIRWLAGATFSIYLFHFPIVMCLTAFFSFSPSSYISRIVIVCSTLFTCFLAAELTERKKKVWQRFFTKLLVPFAAERPLS